MLSQGNTLTEAGHVVLLPSARTKFDDMLAAMHRAEHSIYLEYYIYHLDSIGLAMLHVLHERASAGVDVRLLIDAYGNHKAEHPITPQQFDSIRALGIQVAVFDPIRFPYIRNFLHRDHRKIVVVDNRISYTGGINVADYYLHGTPRTGPWRDLQVRLDGPVAAEMQRIFLHTWEDVTHNHVSSPPLSPPVEERGDGEEQDSIPVIIVNREAGALSRRMRRAYVSTFDAARHDITIVNPYPTNVPSVRRAMKRALRRGVRLRIMVSATSDNRIMPEVLGVEMKRMAQRGAEVYYYEGGFHHTKVITVDDSVAVLGTTNLDGRSLRYDYEVSAYLFSPQIVRQLDSIFISDLQQSEQLTKRNFRKRFSLGRRIVGRMFQPIKRLL